jgi:hypothetical protein
MSQKIFGQCVCIGGMPGIGSVGKVSADYIATALECRTFQLMVSTGFPPEVPVEDGIARALQVELKASEGRDDLILLCGDAQPLKPPHMYNLAGEILKALASYDVTDIVTLAAYVGTSEETVYGVATDPGLAPLYGIRGVCLMGKTDGEKAVDLSAAEGLIGATSDLLGLDVPMEILGWIREEEPKKDERERQPPWREEDYHAGYR